MRVDPSRAASQAQAQNKAQLVAAPPSAARVPSERLNSGDPRALERALGLLEAGRAPAKGTAPTPIYDISRYYFHRQIRPDGIPVLVEYAGSIAIPQTLLPGGVEMPPLELPGKSLNILALGDGGHGNESQRETAAALGRMARERGMNFFVHLGDVIYPHGIVGVSDPQLQSKYTDMYGTFPNQHGIAGNHDYGNSRGAGIPEALVEAANAKLPGFFQMPQRYYSRRVLVDGMTIRTLFLDTSTLAVDPVQLAWIRRELAKDADYTIVFGHHPIANIGWHGATAVTKELLLPLLEARADLYVCGHEHNQQQLRSDGGLPTVVSGAASESRPTIKWGNSEFASMRRGGAFFKVSRAGITFEALSSSKESVLFTNTFQRRERTALPAEVLPMKRPA